MTILFLALWLQMSAQPVHDRGCYQEPIGDGQNVKTVCYLGAADETDGKPQDIIFTSSCPPNDCSDMFKSPPVDVPAVQVGISLGCESTGEMCVDHSIPVYSCKDKSRVLLTSEDGKKHCIKF